MTWQTSEYKWYIKDWITRCLYLHVLIENASCLWIIDYALKPFLVKYKQSISDISNTVDISQIFFSTVKIKTWPEILYGALPITFEWLIHWVLSRTLVSVASQKQAKQSLNFPFFIFFRKPGRIILIFVLWCYLDIQTFIWLIVWLFSQRQLVLYLYMYATLSPKCINLIGGIDKHSKYFCLYFQL